MTTLLTLPVIYNTTIGTTKSKQWRVSVLDNGDNTFTIHSEYGTVGGKQITHDTVITEGKNVGKKNETTPQQQAQLEAERDWAKKIKQGYHETLNQPTAKEEGRLLKPMLATEFNMDSTKLTFPVYVQPKLDGVRCLIYKQSDGTIVFQSRQNTVYEPFPHLVPDLEQVFTSLNKPDIILDGELYTHGMPFETITSITRSSSEKRVSPESLNYCVYDCFYGGDETDNNMTYHERNTLLKAAFNPLILHKVQLVVTQTANSKEEIENYHEYFTTNVLPYEGIMIRTFDGTYKQQNRSKSLQKYKKFMDAEFKVIGHHLGTGAHSGTAIFECESNIDSSKKFSVTMQGSIDGKREMLANISQYYGKWLTVKYQSVSKVGVPRFPVGISFRDYE